ncbi:hypothetical protein FHS27_004270 [Rhodopirellula rubra]|uniref:Uncharacterized protein n=1 Tax=Aporhodopirellula rubra TaxID=980271 RepID=A0A7W5E1K7_9BACT|nr:hypothetical protein [Aporhodopirellula rubra]MBB3208441.1 hypothetical protein [Aporhodopirellula rubra]
MDDFLFDLIEFESALPWVYAEEDDEPGDVTIELEMVIELVDEETGNGESD